MREWLTFIIVLLIAGVMLDGLRRMRRARRESLRLSRRARKLDLDDLPDPNTEVCSEPRVVRQRDKSDAESLTKSMRDSFAKTRVTVGAPRRIPEQVSLNLEQAVPMLMDSVEERDGQAERDYTQAPSWADTSASPKRKPEVRNEEPVYQEDDWQENEPIDEEVAEPWGRDDGREASAYDFDDVEPVHASQGRSVSEPTLGSLDDLADEEPGMVIIETDEDFDTPDEEQNPPPRAASKREREQEAPPEPEEVLIINLMAPAGHHFQGDALLDALVDQGLRFGAMNIFHRHEYRDGSGPIRFSLANMVVPGTFNLASMSEFSTPGVSMFMSLPNEDDSLAAFECMAETAKALAAELGGELKDENRSVMTRQTLEHCRQRVLEFERKQRLMQRA